MPVASTSVAPKFVALKTPHVLARLVVRRSNLVVAADVYAWAYPLWQCGLSGISADSLRTHPSEHTPRALGAVYVLRGAPTLPLAVSYGKPSSLGTEDERGVVVIAASEALLRFFIFLLLDARGTLIYQLSTVAFTWPSPCDSFCGAATDDDDGRSPGTSFDPFQGCHVCQRVGGCKPKP